MPNIEKLINDKLDNLFQEVQQEAGITAGDIAPEDQKELDTIKNNLAGLLYLIFDYQQEVKTNG